MLSGIFNLGVIGSSLFLGRLSVSNSVRVLLLYKDSVRTLALFLKNTEWSISRIELLLYPAQTHWMSLSQLDLIQVHGTLSVP